MQVTKPQVEEVLKTLPIGYYLGRGAKVELSENEETSHANLLDDSLTIAMKNITTAASALPASAESYWSIEKLTRCILYHEVGHLIYTHEELMDSYYYGSTPGLTSELMREGLNTIEDERLESRLQGAVLGVDFKRFVKLACGLAPSATPRLPKNASAQDRLFAAVRFGVGSQADLQAVSVFWAKVNARKTVLHNSCRHDADMLNSEMRRLVEYFYSTQTQPEEAPEPENVNGPESPTQDRQDGGEKPEESEAPETPEQDEGEDASDNSESENGESNESDDEDGQQGQDESEEQEQDGETGEDEKRESGDASEQGETKETEEPESGDGEDSPESEQEEGEDANAGEGEEQGSSEKGDSQDGESEDDGEDGDGESSQGGGDAPIDEDAVNRLREDAKKALREFDAEDGSPVKKATDRLVRRYKTRAGSRSGEREEYATGRVCAKAVALNEDRLFRDRGHGAGRGSQQVALTAWIDGSASFSPSMVAINNVLKQLRRAEKESGGALVVDVVVVGACLTDYFPKESVEASFSKCGDALVLKKRTPIEARGGNRLSEDYIKAFKKTRHANARQFDLVVFDGGCADGVYRYWRRRRRTIEEAKKMPIQSTLKKHFDKTEIAVARCWDNPRTCIISDWANAPLFNGLSPHAKKKFMTGHYADQLEEMVAEFIEKL